MSPVTILSFEFPAKLRAPSGQKEMHFGSPLHKSQIAALRVREFIVIAPYSQASIHHGQPLQLPWLTSIAPVWLDLERAFSGQAVMQGALTQPLQVTAVLKVWLILTERMRDFSGLKTRSFS
jgi:hypothetical protein